MNVYLSFNNGAEILELPVLPDQLEISTGLSNSTLEVVSLGEIGVIGNRRLNTITISSFFPKNYASYCQYIDIPEPSAAVETIEKWRDSKRPIRLSITGEALNISMACMIEDFSYREKGGQPGDIYYDLDLKEYRFIQAKVIKESTGTAGQQLSVKSVRADDRQIPATYTVKEGDALYTIAKRFYNDGAKWRELYEKNKSTIGGNPDLIIPGQVLTL